MLGEAYRGMAQTIIPIIALTALLSGLRGQYFDYAFHLGLRTDRHVLVVGIMALVNLVAGLVLIHIVGAEGAALGTLLAYATGLCASIVLGRRVFPLPAIPGTLARIGAAALIMMAVVSLVPLSDPLAALIVKAPLGALIYGALLLAFDVAGLKAFLIARLPRFRRAGSLEA
jgi:O-antigen/teichoic acid export membrane protein